MKKILSIVLCVLLAVSLFGCKAGSSGINLQDKLTSLMVADDELGLKGKYALLSDITDGSIDSELLGTWKTSDGETSYAFSDDGIVKATSVYGETEAKFTCLTIGEHKVMCEESDMESYDVDGNITKSTVISYSTYCIENDAIYFNNVEDTTYEYVDSSQYALIIIYRADENGSVDAAVAENGISLDSFNGTWVSDKGQITIEKDGSSSAYSVNISVRKQYDSEDKTQATVTTALGIYFTGADKNDKPNLESVLDDWGDFQPNYYSATFDLQQNN